MKGKVTAQGCAKKRWNWDDYLEARCAAEADHSETPITSRKDHAYLGGINYVTET